MAQASANIITLYSSILVLIAAILAVAYYISSTPQTADSFLTNLTAFAPLVSGIAGAWVTYTLITQKETTKENALIVKVKQVIRFELQIYHDLLDDAVKQGEPIDTAKNVLTFDYDSDVAKRFRRIDFFNETRIYTLLDTRTKVTTLAGETILEIEQVYKDIKDNFQFCMWAGDPKVGVNVDKSKELIKQIRKVIDLLK